MRRNKAIFLFWSMDSSIVERTNYAGSENSWHPGIFQDIFTSISQFLRYGQVFIPSCISDLWLYNEFCRMQRFDISEFYFSSTRSLILREFVRIRQWTRTSSVWLGKLATRDQCLELWTLQRRREPGRRITDNPRLFLLSCQLVGTRA